MITVIDFDGTVFKRNYGLVKEVIDYLDNRSVYVLTYRASDQLQFILDTLRPTRLKVVGVAFADSRQKDPARKVALMKDISRKYKVELAVDDDPEVRSEYRALGVTAIGPEDILRKFSGSFTKRKHIGDISFVPINQMSPRDWLWLDFDNTRLIAQARVADSIMSGKLDGFFRVNLIDKAAKNEYLWPASNSQASELANDTWSGFGYRADIEDATTALERLNQLRMWVSLSTPTAIAAILEHTRDKLSAEEAEKFMDLDLDSLPNDAVELILSAILMKAYEYEEAIALLEELPDSDEASEVRDYLDSLAA